jgi:hypothetical protein
MLFVAVSALKMIHRSVVAAVEQSPGESASALIANGSHKETLSSISDDSGET